MNLLKGFPQQNSINIWQRGSLWSLPLAGSGGLHLVGRVLYQCERDGDENREVA